MSIRAIARNVAYTNKCVTVETWHALKRRTNSSSNSKSSSSSSNSVVEEEEEEPKRPRQTGGWSRGRRGATCNLSLGTAGCRNLGRLNLRQLPLAHHRHTLSPQLLLPPLYAVSQQSSTSSSSWVVIFVTTEHYARRRDTSLCPTWCKRAFKSRHLASRQSRQTRHTRYNRAGTGERTCARAACTVFSVAARLSPSRHLPSTLHPDPFLLPSFPLLLRSKLLLRSPPSRARARDQGVAEGSRRHLCPPPSVPHPPTPL